MLAELPEEQKPIAEQVLKGGIPAVRQAVQKQNETNRAEGKPEIADEPLVAVAEQLLPRLRAAEWRDRAEAALASLDELDLRDLRSVVVAADAAARDDESRALADRLRDGLSRRVEEEHRSWLAEIDETVQAGRVVRALRLSSRPPKAGTPFPSELAGRLAGAASASLTADTAQDRYATVLDALAYAPVRAQVEAQGLPAEPSPELVAAVTKLAGRLPKIAAQFGIEAPATPARGKGRRPRSGAPVPPPPPLPSPPPPLPSPPTAPVATSETAPPPPIDAPAAEPPAIEPPAIEPPAIEPPTPAEPPAIEPPKGDGASPEGPASAEASPTPVDAPTADTPTPAEEPTPEA